MCYKDRDSYKRGIDILKWIVSTLLYFYISGSQMPFLMSYVNYKPSMVRLSYCNEDTSGYSPVSDIFFLLQMRCDST
jgi:hypothetical protein